MHYQGAIFIAESWWKKEKKKERNVNKTNFLRLSVVFLSRGYKNSCRFFSECFGALKARTKEHLKMSRIVGVIGVQSPPLKTSSTLSKLYFYTKNVSL